jgi:hypothetical protein
MEFLGQSPNCFSKVPSAVLQPTWCRLVKLVFGNGHVRNSRTAVKSLFPLAPSQANSLTTTHFLGEEAS